MSDDHKTSDAANDSSSEATSYVRYSTHKAGMDGLDKETIMQIIVENSKGSKFYENELRRERLLKQQISQKLEQIQSLKEDALKSGEVEADSLLVALEQRRCFTRCIVHVDMDAFYAAVEIRDQPELRFLPVAVGSNSMLSTSNYIARRFGVRAGLPGFLGRKLCPNLRIIPLDFSRYTEASRAVRAVLSQYAVIKSVANPDTDDSAQSGDPLPTAMVTTSLDEAYLDLTQHLIERQSWPEDRRSYWPRPAPGAKMLVCRCSARQTKSSGTKKSHSRPDDSSSLTSVVQAAHTEDNAMEENGTKSPADQNKHPVDLELAVCDNCGLLMQSGCRVFGTSAWEAVREIRFRVFCATQLTCSAGIGPNTLIAKIASDWCKPMGQFEVPRSRDALNEFVKKLPVRKVPGIGHVTERRLDAFGIRTCGDLITQRGKLWHVSTRSTMTYYMRIALGHSEDDWLPCSDPTLIPITAKALKAHSSNADSDSNQARAECDRKSMSVERTFSDTSDPTELFQRCHQLAAKLSSDLKEEHVKGRHLTLKLKLDTFENRSRSQMLPDYTNDTEVIATFGIELLREEMAIERTAAATHNQTASTSHCPAESHGSRRLTLRLMGLRMASLLPVEMCPQIRQRSIEEALSRVLEMQPSNPPAALETTQGITCSVRDPPKTPSAAIKLRTAMKVQGKRLRLTRQKQLHKKPLTKFKRNQPKLNRRHKPNKTMNKRTLLHWVPTDINNSTCTDSQTVGLPVTLASTSHVPDTGQMLISCPVCEMQFQMQSEQEFNHHLDTCLSRDAITEAVRETLSTPSDGSHKLGKPVASGSQRRPIGSRTPSRTPIKKPKPTGTSSALGIQGFLDKFVHS